MNDYLLNNWKTAIAGGVLMLEGGLGLFGVHIPGFSMDPMAAITMGMGLIVAKDAGKS